MPSLLTLRDAKLFILPVTLFSILSILFTMQGIGLQSSRLPNGQNSSNVVKMITENDEALSSAVMPEAQIMESSKLLLSPYHLFNEYRTQHSHPSLLSELYTTNINNRSFVIGYYSCPHQAGNRLHHFFNAFIWAMVVNRTLLWQYYDKETCQVVGKSYDDGICEFANTVHDCDTTTLQRASWIPSYQEWSKNLGLPKVSTTTRTESDDVIYRLNYWTTHPKPSDPENYNKRKPKFPWKDSFERNAGLDEILLKAKTKQMIRVVDFPQMLGQDSKVLRDTKNLEYLLHTDQARERARALLSLGSEFLYGMLFRELFRFRKHLLPRNDVNVTNDKSTSKNAFSIAIHSRHSKIEDSGKQIEMEINCIQKLLQEHRSTVEKSKEKGSCNVYIMSDRSLTVSKLSEFVENKLNCTAYSVAHSRQQHSWRQEHGPYSGEGFFRDLALATHHPPSGSYVGFIGAKSRSSSLLLQELIEYDRMVNLQQEQIRHNKTITLNKLPVCWLPK